MPILPVISLNDENVNFYLNKIQIIIILMIFHLKGKTNNEMHNELRERETKIQIDKISKQKMMNAR